MQLSRRIERVAASKSMGFGAFPIQIRTCQHCWAAMPSTNDVGHGQIALPDRTISMRVHEIQSIATGTSGNSIRPLAHASAMPVHAALSFACEVTGQLQQLPAFGCFPAASATYFSGSSENFLRQCGEQKA